MKHLTIAAAIIVAFTPAAIPAQSTSDDVRCLLLSSTFARTSKEPRAQLAAQASAGYYLGRIDGRVPVATLKAEMATQLKALAPAAAPKLMNDCVNRMAAANRAMQALAAQSAPAPIPAPTRAQPGR